MLMKINQLRKKGHKKSNPFGLLFKKNISTRTTQPFRLSVHFVAHSAHPFYLLQQV